MPDFSKTERVIEANINGLEAEVAWLSRAVASADYRVPSSSINRIVAARAHLDALITDVDDPEEA